MQYKYYYTTNRKVAGHIEFSDLFDAIQYMNKHVDETFGLLRAEIWDIVDKRIVVSKRVIK